MSIESKEPSISTVGDRCCGCGGCAAACPVSCLRMKSDECGFLHPAYESGCVGCGGCAMACPVLTVGERDNAMSVFWAKAKDGGLRARSSSGAVFGLLAEGVLCDGGTVYGAAFLDGCRSVHHVRVDAIDDLDAVMRSKYVQSTVGVDVYNGVDRDLRDGRKVLFSGTACQVAAMRKYLTVKKGPTENLLLVDVICHGVPSPRLWTEWLDHVSQSVGTEVDFVNFRSKSTGWLTSSVAYYVMTEKVRSATNSHDWYMKAFLNNASLRRSCLECPAKRCCGSDITLGDFWGVQGIHPDVVDNLGVSAVICNTEKGRDVFDSMRVSLESGPSSLDEVIPGNPALMRSASPYPKSDEFLADVGDGTDVGTLMHKWRFEKSMKQKARERLSTLKHWLTDNANRQQLN